MDHRKMYQEIGDIGYDIVEEAESFRRVTRKGFRPAILAAAIVALIAIFSVGAVSASYDIAFVASEYFGGEVELINEMYAVTDNVRVRGNNDDVKFDVVGIVGDRNTAYVWIDVTLPADIDLDGKYLMFGQNVRAEKRGILFGYDNFGSSAGTVTQKSENVYSIFCCFNSHSNSLVGQKVRITVTDIFAISKGVVTHPKYYETIAEGKWVIDLSLNYRDVTEAYYPDVKGQKMTVPADEDIVNLKLVPISEIVLESCEVELSPIGITVRFFTEIQPPYNTISHADLLTLVFADGEEREMRVARGGSHITPDDFDDFYSAVDFGEPIATDTVVGIIYCGLYIPLK